MNIKCIISPSFFTVSFLGWTTLVQAQASFDIESGFVFTGYNNVRISGSQGTLFSLKDDFDAKPSAFVRIRAGYTIKTRHSISALYAPLLIKSDGISEIPINFQGVNFQTNAYIHAKYQFNSYRLTYRYDLVKRKKIEFGLGFTAKIRDAEIALQSQTLSASKKNVGFVPIVNFRFNWRVHDKFSVLLDGDALVASQGRAEDILIAGTYKISDKLKVRLGYRILEGGADGNQVYNFSLLHYASFGITYEFTKTTQSK
jgi:hypothetical protein